MNTLNDPLYRPFATASIEPRWSVRDSYVPATGLTLAMLASAAMWMGLVEAIRWAGTGLF